MNWPELSPECSQAIADVLKDVVQSKPKDLLGHVAQKLQERSGLDPDEFEAHFQECRRQPRTYVLEERCPPDKDPFAWVPMRYNDDTILSILQQRASEFVSDILHEDAEESSSSLPERACVAFPELMYLRDSREEIAALQAIRALCVGCSSRELSEQLEDVNPQLSFRCAALFEGFREKAFQPVRNAGHLDALILCCVLLAAGENAAFQKRYGGGLEIPEPVVLHAIMHEPQALPSFRRLSETYKGIVAAIMSTHFPLQMLISTEVSPAHFSDVKEALSSTDGAIEILVGVVAVGHLVRSRSMPALPAAADLAKLATQCLAALGRYGPTRAYELFLKKRLERHSWRLVKDDLLHRAVVRLSCLAGVDETEAWWGMMGLVEGLSSQEKEVLQVELGRKDGLAEVPAYCCHGAGELLSRAASEGRPALQAAVRLLVRVLDDAARSFDRTLNHRIVTLRLGELVARSRGLGPTVAELPFTLQELGMGDVAVLPAGGGR